MNTPSHTRSPHVDLLRLPLSACGPEAKYFLVRLVQIFGPGQFVAKTHDEFKKLMGLTEKTVSSATRQLIRAGYLLDTPTKSKGVRKTAYCFIAQEELDALPPHTLDPHLTALINDLLETPAIFAGGSRKAPVHPLTPSQKILLATLLAHSEDNFTVSTLGVAQLGRLTGMKADRVRNQIEVLIKGGYIRAIVPGITGHYIFGSRPSIYYMSLGSKHSKEPSPPNTFVLQHRKWYVEEGECIPHEAHMMYSVAMANRAAMRLFPIPAPAEFKCDPLPLARYHLIVNVAQFAKSAYERLQDSNPHIANYLQAYIERTAGALWCKYPDSFYAAAEKSLKTKERHLPTILPESLISSVVADITYSNMPDTKQSDHTREAIEKNKTRKLAEWIVSVATDIALDSQMALLDSKKIIKPNRVQYITMRERTDLRLVRIWY